MAIFSQYNPFKSWQEAFENACNQLDIPPPSDLIADGQIHRYSANSKKSKKNAWYCIFNDGDIAGGVIGDWSLGEKQNWYYCENQLTPVQKHALAEKWKAAAEKSEQEEKARHKAAGEEAAKKWAEMTDTVRHPYLEAKGVKPYGVKTGKNRLYVSVSDNDGITSLQAIDHTGFKQFLEGGKIKGGYFLIGSPVDRLMVAEGYATGASIYQATGYPVAIVFNAGNMAAAIENLKKRFPKANITICADNDIKKQVNVGLQKARQAATEYGATLAYPVFTKAELDAGNPNDFNDLHKLRGLTAVKEAIDGKPKENLFKFLSIVDLYNLPPIEWLIDGVIPQSSFSIIYGEPEKGKTFVALDMALSVATGYQWAEKDVEQTNVLYISGEGKGGLPRRVKAWEKHYHNGNQLNNFYVLPTMVNMMDGADTLKLLASIEESGIEFGLIFIDTVARALVGGDENSANDMGMFVAACDQLRDCTGASIVGIHHSGKDVSRGMRGSNALLGACDTVFQVNREENNVFLKMEKQKDAEHMPEMAFAMKSIDIGIGQTSLILEPTIAEKEGKPDKTKNSLYLDVLHDLLCQPTDRIYNQPAIKLEAWRHECQRRELGGDSVEAKRKAFYRERIKLQEAKIVGCQDNLVWVIRD